MKPERTPEGTRTVMLERAPSVGSKGPTLTLSTLPMIFTVCELSVKVTMFSLATGEKFLPLRVRMSPGFPSAGEMLVTIGKPTGGGASPGGPLTPRLPVLQPAARVSASNPMRANPQRRFDVRHFDETNPWMIPFRGRVAA